MPKKPPRTPSYRRHKGTGQAVVTLSGRDHYLGKYGTKASRERYDQLISEWLTHGRQLPGSSGHPDLTISELAAAYWRFAETYYVRDGVPTGELRNMRDAVRPLVRLYGRKLASDFGPVALKAIREAMVKANLARTVVNARVNRIRRVFKWGIENEFVTPSVLHGLQAVSGLRRGRSDARETGGVKPVPDEHVDAVKPHVSRQVWAVIELQRLTGARSGEVVIMRARDVDMTGDLWLYRPSRHKTDYRGHERIIELGPRAQEVVRPLLKPDLDGYLFSPRDADDERRAEMRQRRKTPVQPSQRDRGKHAPRKKPGDHYSPQSYGRAIKEACKAAGVPHWAPHQLRHAFGTRIRKQFGLEIARALLGHKSVPMAELYSEIDRAKVREVMTKIG